MAAISEKRRRTLQLQAAAALSSLQAARGRGDELSAALAEHNLNLALDQLQEASDDRHQQ